MITADTYTPTKDTDFYPVLGEAYWLSFVTNKAYKPGLTETTTVSGAPYISKKQVAATQPISSVQPAEPVMTGYEFKGWYTSDSFTEEVDWNDKLTADRTVYAKWEPKVTSYTIIIWKQQATDAVDAEDSVKKYDYEESVKITGVYTGDKTDIEKDYEYYNKKSYTGFKYSRCDDNTTIAADGSTILNVYYDRNVITINFIYNRNVISSYVEYTYSWDTYRDWNSYYYLSDDSYRLAYYSYGNWYDYDTDSKLPSGTTIYEGVYAWKGVETHRGLYEAALDFEWPSGSWQDSNEIGLVFIGNYILPNPADTTIDLYLKSSSGSRTKYVRFYKENDEGEYDLALTYEYKIDMRYAYKGWAFFITDKYTGYKADHYNTGTWSREQTLGEKDDSTGYYKTVENFSELNIYYKRLSYTVDFKRVDTAGAVDAVSDSGIESATVTYGAKITEPETDPTPAAGYRFKGWYKNPEGTEPFDFDNETMPANNLVVYACFEPISYYVKIDLNGGTISTGEGQDQQKTEFWISYLEKIDGGVLEKATQEGYKLVGWYYEDTNGDLKSYNFSNQVTDEYISSETVKGTDEYAGITYSVIKLKALWKRDGSYHVSFSVQMSVNGGGTETKEITDARNYKYGDQAKVVLPTYVDSQYIPDGKRLTGWTIKDGDGNEMKFALGAVVTLDSSWADNKGKILITAVYADAVVPTTSIVFNGNGGTNESPLTKEVDGNYTADDYQGLDLNGNKSASSNKVDLPSAGFTRDGYTLIGWSKTSGNNTVDYILGGQYVADQQGSNVLYAVWAENLNVSVVGNEATYEYDSTEKSNATTEATNGYTVTLTGATDDIGTVTKYDVADAVISKYVTISLGADAKTPVTGTNAGEYPMGLSATSTPAGTVVTIKKAEGSGSTLFQLDGKYYLLKDTTTTDGKLTITKKAVTITANSKEQGV